MICRRVERAQDLFDRFRLTGLLILGCASLPQCYAHGEIANTLTLSGLLGMRVRQRIEETAVFVNAVMAPKSFVDRSAFPWMRKIRLIHATMRRLTLIPADAVEERDDNSVAGFMLARKWPAQNGMPLDQSRSSRTCPRRFLRGVGGLEDVSHPARPQGASRTTSTPGP